MSTRFCLSVVLLLLSPLILTGQDISRSLPGDPEWGAPVVSIRDFPRDQVMIVSHRGDWRSAPENSLWSIKCAADAGADMVEIDVALTRDSVLILMHDRTVDRTTTGSGRASDLTYDEIKELYLRDGMGLACHLRVPTLEEVLLLCKDRIMLNLDKGFDYIDLIYPMVERLGMSDQVLYKGRTTREEYEAKYGSYAGKIAFMPIIPLDKLSPEEARSRVADFVAAPGMVVGFEFTLGMDENRLIDFAPLRERGMIVWMNSLRDHHCGGHTDDRAFLDPSVYDWFIQHDINCIQTDRIDLLKSYLTERGLTTPLE